VSSALMGEGAADEVETERAKGLAAAMLLRPSVVRSCSYAFVFAAAMDLVTLLTTSYATSAVRATYVGMIICYLGFSVVLRVKTTRLLTDPAYSEVFARVGWTVVTVGLLVRMGIALFTADDLATTGDAVLSVFVGLIVMYLMAFILFERTQAIAASLVTMASSAVLVGVRIAVEEGPALLASVTPYVRAYGIHVVVVVYLYVMARTKEVLSESHSRANALTISAGTDELTGLANRRQLATTLVREIAHSRRTHTPLAVVILDIDHFKAINDTHGHAAGDDALRHTAAVLRAAIRASDLAGRWGGEEFLLVLPDADTTAALGVADRCRRALRAHHFDDLGTVTASFGVATLQPLDDPETLIARADDALYAAKADGRDRVHLASPA
jgi:diguanylate cyclase (GGDEF)-like protein